ncbi:MAG: ABC transporter permease [Candidatus Spechtbacterales bacterium]|nr:ABC transporter permease [Candidatus Spechtbacterales bacterium]
MKSIATRVGFRVKKARESSFLEVIRLLWADPLGRGSIIVLVAFFTLAVLSFVWTPYDFRAQDFIAARQGPSAEHWFGTDLLGRDMFTRVVYSARITTILMFMTLFLGGLPLAIFFGIVPIFISNKLDSFVQRIGELMNSIPPLLFILLFTALARPVYDDFLYEAGSLGRWFLLSGFADLALIMVVSWIFLIGASRMFRSMVLELREAAFVERAKMLGASRTRIIVRHILPQLYPYIVHAALSASAGVIGTEIALSFFGIGIRPPHPSFGAMFSESASIRLLNASPHMLIIPGIIVALFLLAIRILDIRSTMILSTEHEREG